MGRAVLAAHSLECRGPAVEGPVDHAQAAPAHFAQQPEVPQQLWSGLAGAVDGRPAEGGGQAVEAVGGGEEVGQFGGKIGVVCQQLAPAGAPGAVRPGQVLGDDLLAELLAPGGA
jgi:hypothetical protein